MLGAGAVIGTGATVGERGAGRLGRGEGCVGAARCALAGVLTGVGVATGAGAGVGAGAGEPPPPSSGDGTGDGGGGSIRVTSIG